MFKVTQFNDYVEIQVDGKIITNYYYTDKYARPFLYPIIGPYGAGVTRGFPVKIIEGETNDHPHHKSIWTAYGDVNGVNNWEEHEGHGKTLHKEFLVCEGKSDMAHLVTLNDWVNKESMKIMEEKREIRICSLLGEEQLFDFVITFKATESDVKFGDTKEGGIVSVRVATSMDGDKGGKIENADGKVGEKETWGKPSNWCDYSGKVDGKEVGIAIFDHPANLRYPTYWHVRDYGLMTANCFGMSHFEDNPNKKGDYVLQKGKELRFRYQVLIHKGGVKEGQVAERYKEYIK